MTNSIFEKGLTTKREVIDIVNQTIADKVDDIVLDVLDDQKNIANGVAGLDANAKISPTQIPGGVKILQSQSWNADTNTPNLLTIEKEIGFCWIVSIAGNTNLSGYTDWQSGDEVIYLGSNNFAKIDNTDNTSLQKTANLSDLTNNATARTNLDVYSKTETNDALNLKANKVVGATPNNFANLNSTGDLIDSGKKASDFEPADITILKEEDVINNLTSTDTNKPLSANQGKVLQDGKANKVSGATNGNFASLNSSGDLVDSTKKPSDFEPADVNILKKSNVIDNLTSTNIDLPLSANQGKVLQDGKVDKITGKGLSTNDFDNTYKAQLDNFTENSQDAVASALTDTATIDLTYNDELNQITADVKDGSINNVKIGTNADISTSKIKQAVITPQIGTFSNNDTQDVINNKAQGQITNLENLINTRPIGASNGSVYYLTSQASAIPNYELLSFSPDNSPLDVESITITSTTPKIDRLFHSYISTYEVGNTIINGGNWIFNFYGYTSHINNNNFEIDVYKRDSSGTETLLFTCDTSNLLQTSQISPELNVANVEITNQDFSCNATDKIVVKIYAKTDRSVATTITLLHSGTDYASHIHTPIIATHNQLAGTQGGSATEKYHLILSDYNKVLALDTSFSLKEDVANKTTAFSATPANTKYPTEKLVKDNLDLKEDLSNKATSFSITPADVKYPTEKLVKDNLDLKENLTNKTSTFSLTPNDTKYPTEKLVKDNLDSIQTQLNNKLETSLKGANNGLAELDSTGKVPSSQLPAYVDDVLEFDNFASFPATGEAGKIYVAKDTNIVYRWGGTQYIEISSSLALGETSSTAYRGDRGKIAYDHSQTTGNPHSTTKGDIGLGNVDNTSDADKPISSATQTALNSKEPTITAGTTSQYYRGDKTFQTLDKNSVGLSNVANIDTTTTANITDSTDKRFVSDAEKTILSNTSGTNTGDETTLSIQTKRPLKTVSTQSLEGNGNISLSKSDVGLNNVDNTADANKNVLSATKLTTARNINGVSFDGTADITIADNTKEPTFTKNTAFNKNFGTTTDTVAEGNDARLGTKNIDETNIANNRIQVYNSTSGKLEYQDKPVGSTNLAIANKTSTTLDITSDTGNDATIPEATNTEAGLLSASDKVKLNNTSGTNTGDQDLSGLMVKAQNLGDVANRQTSLNNITGVNSATNEYVLTKDTATGNALWKVAQGGGGDINVETFIQQANAPTNPDSGKNKLYFKTDGNLYKLNNLGVETQIASGSSTISLDDLTDVGISSPANSQILLFVNGKWENRAITACEDLFGSGGKIPITKIDINTINIRGTWNANTNITYPKAGGTGAGLTDGAGSDGDVWIVQTAGNTTLGGYTGWAVNDWAYRNGTSWVKLANGSTVLSVNSKTGAVVLAPNDLLLSSGSAISGTINAGDGIETAILKIKNFINNASTNKQPLTYFVNASDIQISGSGTSATISWNAQSNAVRYRVFAKQTSLGAINIITDTPVATVNAPTNFTTVSVNQGIGYTYAVLADKSTDTATDIINFTTSTSISNFTLDTFDLSAGTTATLAWGSVVGAVEYRIQYQRATSLSNPTIISSITGTSRTITGLTASNPDDATTPYSFKVLAYNSSSQVIAETAVITRPVFARITLRYFYDSFSNITVSSITRSADLATCNTTANHGLRQGDVITITSSVAPFNVSYALVFDTPALNSFRYIVTNSGATNSNTATLQKFENPFITWSYYKFSQYILPLQDTTKRMIPRNPWAYMLASGTVNYNSQLLFDVSKYSNTGDAIAGWCLVKYHDSDNAIAVLTDTKRDVAMQMFDGTFSYTDRQDKFAFAADDHRCYKLWHGGFAYLQNAGSSDSQGSNFYKLKTDLTTDINPVGIANRPTELSSISQAMPVRLSLSGYTVYFDNNNQRMIIQKKDGTRTNIISYSSIGLNSMFGFTVNVGGGSNDIAGYWYTITNNLDTIIIANRSNASIGSYRIVFNFDAQSVFQISTIARITNSSLGTEENCFGDQIDTYFNLRNNSVQAVRYVSGAAPTLTFEMLSTALTDPTSNTSQATMTVPGDITQIGTGPVSVITIDGSVYYIDWGHDDRGMFRITGNDDGLGIVKMINMSVHTRLLPII